MVGTVRLATRTLVASPVFSVVGVITLAVAIGANTAVFSLVDAVVLKPPPFRHAETLFQVWTVQPGGFEVPFVPADVVLQWNDVRPDALATLEAYQFAPVTLLGAGDPVTVPATMVTGGLMDLLGVQPLLGRTIQRSDAHADSPAVAVIGENLWRTRFGGNPKVLGHSLRLNDGSYEVVGVLPRTFRFPRASHQIWIPLARRELLARRTAQVLSRLRAGAEPAAAERQLETLAQAVDSHNTSSPAWMVRLRQYGTRDRQDPARTALLLLLGSVGLVLLIACANVAALVAARSAARDRELAVQVALGATRSHVLRHIISETVLLTGAAATIGFVLSVWLIDLLQHFSPDQILRFSGNEVAWGWRVFGFTAFLGGVTALLVGIMPGLRASRVNAADVLRSGRSAGAATGQKRFRQATVAFEVAVSVLLLVGTGLLARTLFTVTRVTPGFEVDRVLTIDLAVQLWKYPTAPAQRQFFNNVVGGLQTLPGVERVVLSGGIPPNSGLNYSLRVTTDDGRTIEDDHTSVLVIDVGRDYFAVLGLPIRQGRAFNSNEVDSESRSIVVSESLAQRLWPSKSAVGRRLRLDADGEWYSVVGVAGDVFQLDYTRPRAALTAYVPLSTAIPPLRTIVVRASGDPSRLTRGVLSEIRRTDPEQPIHQVATAEELHSEFLNPPRFYAYIMAMFAAVATLLASLGLYGVVSHATTLRTREFGIRLALGSQPRALQLLMLREGFRLVGVGLLIGVGMSFFATRIIETLLVDVPRFDSSTYAAVTVMVSATTYIACWLPARRASKTDPALTLRQE
jgi:predicted permease